MKKMGVMAFILAIMLITSVFAGCSQSQEDNKSSQDNTSTTQNKGGEASGEKPTIVLSRWAGPHADDQKTVLSEYANAEAKMDDIDYGNLKQKQIQSMTSSADYDLVWVQEIWLPEYVSKDWLMPLDEIASKSNADLGVYSKSMLEMNKVDGKLYALPTFAQTHILTYNKEWFEREGQKVPTTVEELIQVAKYFKEKGTGIAIPASQGQAAADVFAQFLYSAGGDYFDSDGKLNLLSDETISAAELWDELCKYSVNGSMTWHHDQVSQAIREEKAPFGITISGLSGMDSNPEVSKIADKVGYAPIPGKKQVAGCVSYWSWAVAKNSKNPEAAAKLALWLTSPEIEKKQALMNGQITAISSLAEDSEVVAKIPFLPAASETLENAKTQPTSASTAKIFEPLNEALSIIATTDDSVTDVFTKLQDELKDVVK